MLVFLLSQYTQKNLEFALTVDPKNEVLVKKMTWVQQQCKDKKATVPSTIGDELEFNPFMRVDKESLQVTGFFQYFPAELLWSSLSLAKN
jgi:hydroxyacylglutathione hydrolase